MNWWKPALLGLPIGLLFGLLLSGPVVSQPKGPLTVPSMFANKEAYTLAARTATPTLQADQTNLKYRGIRVFVYTTAAGSSPSTTFTVQGKDPVTGQYYTLLASAAVTATGFVQLYVYPGAAVTANASANAALPSTWRINVSHGNATSHTYQVSYELLP